MMQYDGDLKIPKKFLVSPPGIDRTMGEHGIEAIIHGGALHKPDIVRYPRQAFIDVNVTGTLNLIEAAVAAGNDRFLFTSTTSLMVRADVREGAGVHGAWWMDEDFGPLEPRNIYGITKLAAEQAVRLVHREHGIAALILRTGRFFPEDDDTHAVPSGPNLKANELLGRRLTVEDAAAAHLAALEAAPQIGCDTFILSAPPPFTKDEADELARDVRKARVELRRWIGERAAAPLQGAAPAMAVNGDALRSALPHHAELAPYAPMRAMAQAEVAEADAEKRGDWSGEVAYSRRPRYDDMVSFQLSFDLPWQRDRRQQPQIEAKRREIERIEAEREELLRRHAAETDAMLAELQALDTQAERLRAAGLPLAAERVALATAAYQAGRGDLAAVLTARSQVLETQLRAIDLDAQRAALRLRLSTLIAE